MALFDHYHDLGQSLSYLPAFSRLCLANSSHVHCFPPILPNWKKCYDQGICPVNGFRLNPSPLQYQSAGLCLPYTLQAAVCIAVPRLLLIMTIQEPCGVCSAEEGAESIVRCTMVARIIDHASYQKPWDLCSQPAYAECCRHQGTRAWIDPSWTAVAAARTLIVQRAL